MYSELPKRVAKAAIVKEGTHIRKKMTGNKIGYSSSLSRDSFSCLYKILFDRRLLNSNSK